MKKTSLIVNVILFIAVAVLYVFHFTGKEKTVESKPIIVEDDKGTPAEIVYVNFDTLISSLHEYTDKTSAFEAKYSKRQAEIENRFKNYQTSILELQEKVQKGLITTRNRQEEEERLQKEQQYLAQMDQQIKRDINEEDAVISRQFMFDIMDYIKKYNAQKNYKYVISNSFGGVLLYGKESLNITQEIIDGMNAEYAKKTNKK